jgi:hypothetical protein
MFSLIFLSLELIIDLMDSLLAGSHHIECILFLQQEVALRDAAHINMHGKYATF